MKFFYDFNINYCFIPSRDEDSNPNNIVNMALIKGLNVIAVSDHNTGKNCPAVMAVGKKNGLVVLPAMELTTSEDIHILCLFETYEDLQKLEGHIQKTRLKIKNKPEVFGRQLIMNERDEVIGEEEHLLIVSSGISVEEVAALVKGFGGIPIPAHIDKQANGIIGILGAFDYHLGFEMIECSVDSGVTLPQITDSDAHYLWDIAEAEHFIEAETCSARGVFEALKKMCKNGE